MNYVSPERQRIAKMNALGAKADKFILDNGIQPPARPVQFNHDQSIEVMSGPPPSHPAATGQTAIKKAHAMKNDFQVLNGAATDESLDNHRNAPRPDPACLYGLVGDVARAGGDTTEANPYAVAANFMAFMACAVGRGPYMPVGNTWHHPRLFMLHIGRSGRGRKGDAVSLISRIERALKALS